MLKKSSLLIKYVGFCTTQAPKKCMSNAKFYVQRFETLQNKRVEQNKKVKQLQKQIQLAQTPSNTTGKDMIRKMISRMTGTHYQIEAIKKPRDYLLELRNKLQKKIEESQVKWQEPRKKILSLRKQLSNDFLSKFVNLDEMMKNVVDAKIGSEQIQEGAQLTHRLLLNTLQKHGIQFYEPQKGAKYDSQMHETASQINQKETQIIKQVMVRGWKIDDKIVKKAIVRL